MRLRDLHPKLYRAELNGTILTKVDLLQNAQGLFFLCPKCFAENKGTVGTHGILIWFADRGVSASATPLPRWTVESGKDFDDLTLSPSIQLGPMGCAWHGWIRNGEAA